jgi:hypothetical protein
MTISGLKTALHRGMGPDENRDLLPPVGYGLSENLKSRVVDVRETVTYYRNID